MSRLCLTCHGDEALFAAVYRVSDEPITDPVEMELKPALDDSGQFDIRFGGQLFTHRIMRLADPPKETGPEKKK